MSFANFGIGLGAFTQGLSGGMQMGTQLRELKNQGDIRRQAQSGIADARQAREAAIDGRIERTGLDGRDDFMGNVTTGYQVDGKEFNNPQQARGQAEKGVDGVIDYFMRDAAPKIAEAYIGQGNIEKADAWNSWIQERNTQQGMAHWAKAMRSAQMGDTEGFVSALEKAYNTPGYLDDGVTVKGHEIGEDGAITMTFERDGKEFNQTFRNSEDITQAGIGLLSPQVAFEMSQAQAQSAAEARAKAGTEELKHRRGLEMEAVRQDGRIDLERVKADLQRRARSSANAPAIVQTAEWLVDNGVATNADDAWNLANMSRTKGRQDFAMDYAKMFMDTREARGSSTDDAIQKGLELYDRIQQESGRSGQGGQANPAAGGIVLY